MKPGRFLFPTLLLGLAALLLAPAGPAAENNAATASALRLHPENPRYFLFRDRPTILLTSGEHYGAVLNLDFDFDRYLATLGAARLNLTRLFTGATYVEPPGAFKIASNTLPRPNIGHHSGRHWGQRSVASAHHVCPAAATSAGGW